MNAAESFHFLIPSAESSVTPLPDWQMPPLHRPNMFSSCAPLTFEALPSMTCGVGRFHKSIVLAALTRSKALTVGPKVSKSESEPLIRQLLCSVLCSKTSEQILGGRIDPAGRFLARHQHADTLLLSSAA
jgi:hypothetical protein